LQYLISTTLTGPSNAVLGASLYSPHWQMNPARFSDEIPAAVGLRSMIPTDAAWSHG